MVTGLAGLKARIITAIETGKAEYIQASHDIHDRPELGNQEVYASKRLSDLLAAAGFTVERDIAGHPTGFVASKQSRRSVGPVLGYLAEYDALPGLGHGCGHNIIGVASVAAAIALAGVLEETGGRVAVFGTPAEEGGENGSAKASYVRQGLFRDVDACMLVHPSILWRLTEYSLALDPLDFEFYGQAAHAASAPEKGVNALDGVIQLFNGINALRQQLPADVRIHGIITHGGEAPNIIPAYAKARFFIRAASRDRCDEVSGRVKAIAQGAALATGTRVAITYFQNPIDDFLINRKFNKLFKEMMEELGESVEPNIKKNPGSTDAGNVSRVVPTIQPSLKIGPDELAGHTVAFCDAAKSPAGDAALITGAKALALTGLVLLMEAEWLHGIKEEFEKSARELGGQKDAF